MKSFKTEHGFVLSDGDEVMIVTITEYCDTTYLSAALIQVSFGVDTVVRNQEFNMHWRKPEKVDQEMERDFFANTLPYTIRGLMFAAVVGDWEPHNGHEEHVYSNMKQMTEDVLKWQKAATEAYFEYGYNKSTILE